MFLSTVRPKPSIRNLRQLDIVSSTTLIVGDLNTTLRPRPTVIKFGKFHEGSDLCLKCLEGIIYSLLIDRYLIFPLRETSDSDLRVTKSYTPHTHIKPKLSTCTVLLFIIEWTSDTHVVTPSD